VEQNPNPEFVIHKRQQSRAEAPNFSRKEVGNARFLSNLDQGAVMLTALVSFDLSSASRHFKTWDLSNVDHNTAMPTTLVPFHYAKQP
jgi:hypothetical protein